MKKVTAEEYSNLIIDYYLDDMGHGVQRLGQYLVNKLDLRPDSELFYCESDDKAHELFQERYLKDA